MNKRLLFGLMAVSILAAGLLIWSCGDDIKVEFPHLGYFLGEPAFRVNALEIDEKRVRCEDPSCSNCKEDRSCNALGRIVAPATDLPTLVPPDVNLIFIYRGLTKDNWTGTIVDGAIVNGLCGIPDGPATCLGEETEFFIDPATYDPVTKELSLVLCDIPVTEGYTEIKVETLSLSFSTDPGPLSLELCNSVINGTVTSDLSRIIGELWTGAITEESLRDFVWYMLGDIVFIMDPVRATFGVPDTECDSEPAYSFRAIFSATIVTLYEVP